jgi:hypothetical protein
LVHLLWTTDGDAVLAAVHVLNIILRRDPDLRSALEEEKVQEALEHVCDSTMHTAAEVAAELIDDFFDNNNNDDDDETMDFGNFGFGQPVGAPSPAPPPQGMGRGRGTTVPSWAIN